MRPGLLLDPAVDVINADGELLHCDEERNSDFLWAARGGGLGQFAWNSMTGWNSCPW